MGDSLNELVRFLAGRDVFGSGQFKSLSMDSEADLGIQLGSKVALVRVNMEASDGSIHALPVVIKQQMENEPSRISRDTAAMFHNEITMYKEILPFLDTSNSMSYPRMYYGLATLGEDWTKDVIIVENIKQYDFKLCKDRVFLDFNHISVSIKKIAELHSWSYNAKHTDPIQFNKIKNKLKKVNTTVNKNFDFQLAIFLCMKRGIDALIDQGKEVELLQNFLDIIKSVFSVQRLLFEPVEPFGAIIHGDYCKNNVFYKYDSDRKPIDCAFFDLQLAKYSSPAIDLSFFLYMHTTEEMRSKYWDIFLTIYWDTVKSNVYKDIKLPTFKEFKDHFATKALHGFIHSSFFVPRMLDDQSSTVDPQTLSNDDRIKNFLLMGGDEARVKVCEIAAHFFENKYIHTFLDYYTKTYSY